MSKYKGDHQIPLQGESPPESFRWTRTGQSAWAFTYRGSFNNLYAKGQLFQADFDTISIDREQDTDFYRMTVAQNGEDIQRIHDVVGSSMMQPKCYNQQLRERLQSVGVPFSTDVMIDKTVNVTADITRSIYKMKAFQFTYAQALDDAKAKMAQWITGNTTATAANLNGVQASLCKELFDDLAVNGEQFLQVQYRYRHIMSYAERVFSRTNLQYVYQNVQRVHSEAVMRAVEDIPFTLQLPTQVRDNTRPAEWLKQAPHVTLSYSQKRTVTIEYIFADVFSRLYYKDAT